LKLRKQMNKELQITISIKIFATPEKVWDALTNPEKIRIYLFGTNTFSDWKKGSDILFKGEYEGHKYEDKGKIIEIKENEILQYTYWSAFSGMEDKEENYSLVTCQLDVEDGKTTLIISQKSFVSQQAQEHSKLAWTNVAGQIKELVEKK